MKEKLHVVSFSGGKDSTAMLLRMLEMKMPVDMVLFCDTGLEFPQLYRHIDKVERDTGLKITRLKPEHDFEYYFAKHKVKRRRDTPFTQQYGKNQDGYSWAEAKMRWCTQVLKTQPRESYFKKLREEYDVIEYVGIAADEQYRLKRNINRRKNCRHPLVDWGMTEADCLAYCREHGYDWEGLYDKIRRVSCWCCPLQSLQELRVLYRDFPELWAQLKKWDEMTWRPFRPNCSVEQLEKRFDFEEEWQKQGKQLRTKEFFADLKERAGNA